ncbi:hypothetical protein B0H16DRAFT_1566987 [Mycena metata]|uniref:Pentatricopeptide repeat protein n=1 Tax=Mycena metata TaxID=1033252 RepID=A0AAD7N0R6_9AGAR|nr:hypothetical protein B0H16DRAFT_1566987 [Mycena metata]
MRIALRHLISLGHIPSHRISFNPHRLLVPRNTHLRHATSLPSHSNHSVPLEPDSPEELEEKKTNDLVASFMEFMDLVKDEPSRRRDEKQTNWIRDRFQADDLQIPSHPKIAENIIHFLFERRLFKQAIAVYQHMVEGGLIPSPSTNALFLAVALATSNAPGKNQLAGFKAVLSYRSFTETHFMELLDHIIALKIPPEIAARLTRMFIAVKGDGYSPSRAVIMKLIDLQTQAGDIMAAADTIDEYDFHQGSSAFESPAEPYARMIHATPASDQAAVDWIMGVMREKDVPVHIMVFNSLITQQKNRKDFRKALAYYNVIIRLATTTPLKPNAVTYKLLFRLYGYHHKNNHKPNASRSDQSASSLIPPPRQLFADMMSLWFSARFHPPASSVPAARADQAEVDQSLMDIIFRSFLYLDDYAAAIVVLRTTAELGLRITVRTYFTLLRYMARKVYYDVHVARVKNTVQPVFAFELMGPFEPREIADDDNAAYEWIMGRLLEHNLREAVRSGDGSGVRVSSEPRRRVPSVAEILEQDGNPTKTTSFRSSPSSAARCKFGRRARRCRGGMRGGNER